MGVLMLFSLFANDYQVRTSRFSNICVNMRTPIGILFALRRVGIRSL